jgi:hypothetical protein
VSLVAKACLPLYIFNFLVASHLMVVFVTVIAAYKNLHFTIFDMVVRHDTSCTPYLTKLASLISIN